MIELKLRNFGVSFFVFSAHYYFVKRERERDVNIYRQVELDCLQIAEIVMQRRKSRRMI